MIATNKTFEQWTDIFTDGVLVGAIADRVVHYSTIIIIKEPSYRTKNLKKVADKKLVSQGI